MAPRKWNEAVGDELIARGQKTSCEIITCKYVAALDTFMQFYAVGAGELIWHADNLLTASPQSETKTFYFLPHRSWPPWLSHWDLSPLAWAKVIQVRQLRVFRSCMFKTDTPTTRASPSRIKRPAGWRVCRCWAHCSGECSAAWRCNTAENEF